VNRCRIDANLPASPKSIFRPLIRTPAEAKVVAFAESAPFMRRPCSLLILCVLLGFGVALAAPAEDVPETAYDESEALPYEVSPLFSIERPLAATRTTQSEVSLLQNEVATLSRPVPARVRDTDANLATDTRISLALLCTLLC
jgi:hypothetical protein